LNVLDTPEDGSQHIGRSISAASNTLAALASILRSQQIKCVERDEPVQGPRIPAEFSG